MGKAAQTRQYIIEKSAPVFNKRGFSGTSLQDLTTATGLTKGSIYGNFENKDEVALEVFHYNLKKMNLFFTAEMSRKDSFREKLLTYPNLYENFLDNAAFPEGGCPILNTAVEADDTNETLKSVARKSMLSWKDSIQLLIESGISAGEFKSDVPPQTSALTMLALLEGATLVGKLTHNDEFLKAIMSSLRKLVMEL
jgi:AcrR family transcriptional regulator